MPRKGYGGIIEHNVSCCWWGSFFILMWNSQFNIVISLLLLFTRWKTQFSPCIILLLCKYHKLPNILYWRHQYVQIISPHGWWNCLHLFWTISTHTGNTTKQLKNIHVDDRNNHLCFQTNANNFTMCAVKLSVQVENVLDEQHNLSLCKGPNSANIGSCFAHSISCLFHWYQIGILCVINQQTEGWLVSMMSCLEVYKDTKTLDFTWVCTKVRCTN